MVRVHSRQGRVVSWRSGDGGVRRSARRRDLRNNPSRSLIDAATAAVDAERDPGPIRVRTYRLGPSGPRGLQRPAQRGRGRPDRPMVGSEPGTRPRVHARRRAHRQCRPAPYGEDHLQDWRTERQHRRVLRGCDHLPERAAVRLDDAARAQSLALPVRRDPRVQSQDGTPRLDHRVSFLAG